MRETSSGNVAKTKSEYGVGIGLLLVVVLLWTTSNFITQDLFEGGYGKPFLLTYLNTSTFALYLLPYLFRSHIIRFTSREYVVIPPDRSSDSLPLTMGETAQLASLFCILWFIANWTVNASLDYTSVASTTVLSSTSGFFTMLIGAFCHVEQLTCNKIGAVMTSFIGVLMVSLSDSSNQGPGLHRKPLLGDALAFTSAIFYALYVILLKVKIKSESRIDMQLFFGFVGLFNVLLCWPIGVLLHLCGLEPFDLPSTSKQVGALLTNMIITLSSDYLYVRAMLRTTPLLVTLGLSLTIPIAVVGDSIIGRPATVQVIFGALMVLGSFLAIAFEEKI